MSVLKSVRSGVAVGVPHLVMVYGPDGVGKTTFAANAPSPLFLDVEGGTKRLPVSRVDASSYELVAQALRELATEEHQYKSVVVDSLDWLEPLLWRHVCDAQQPKWSSIEAPGYGKGYVAAKEEWKRFRDLLLAVHRRGLHVILIAHSEVKTFNDPITNAAYDRYQVKLHDKSASLLREFVENVLFMQFEVVTKESKGEKTKAYGEGQRYLYTERRPAFDAKNRLGLPFAIALPQDGPGWKEFLRYADAPTPAPVSEESIATMMKEIAELTAKLTDPGLVKTVMETTQGAGSDPAKLTVILERLRIRARNQ